MSWAYPLRVIRCRRIAGAFLLAFAIHRALAGDSPFDRADDSTNPAKNLARMNCGATIDLIGPDGRAVVVTNKATTPNALLLDDDTLNYPLPAGDTTFVLSLPRISALGRFTFVNENATAAGEMTIAVSNYRLAANSRKWIEISSGTSFTGKRLFDLSLAGTEARYVKISFHVDKEGLIAGIGLYGEQSLQKFAAR